MAPGPAIVADGVSEAAVLRLKIGGGGEPWQDGILVNGGDLRIADVEIAGATQSGIEARGDGSVQIERCHIHDNGGAGVALRDEAAGWIIGNQISGNGKGLNLPAIQIASLKPSRITANYLEAPGASIWQPLPAVRELLECNYFGPAKRVGQARDVRTTGGTR